MFEILKGSGFVAFVCCTSWGALAVCEQSPTGMGC